MDRAIASDKVEQSEYFHGVLTKEEAEKILMPEGQYIKGYYLIRRSVKPPQNYALAISDDNQVHHYMIQRVGGKYCIPGGKQHSSVCDLVLHHKKKQDGLQARTSVPCPRPKGKGPFIWAGVTSDDVRKKLNCMLAAYAANIQPMSERRAREKAIKTHLCKVYHMYQCWYAEGMERAEAEAVLCRTRLERNGKYLLRRNKEGNYCLSMLCNRVVHHYAIEVCVNKDGYETFTIEGMQQEFACIMDLLTVCHDMKTLECKLTEPCHIEGERNWLAKQRNVLQDTTNITALQRNVVYQRREYPVDDESIHSNEQEEQEDDEVQEEQEQEGKEEMVTFVAHHSSSTSSTEAVQRDETEYLLNDQNYYYANITRREAELLLGAKKGSTYLVRRRAYDGQYILSHNDAGHISHSEIIVSSTSRGRVVFSVPGIGRMFYSLDQLIESTVKQFEDIECDGRTDGALCSETEVKQMVMGFSDRGMVPTASLDSLTEREDEEEDFEDVTALMKDVDKRYSREIYRHSYMERFDMSSEVQSSAGQSYIYEEPLYNIAEDQLVWVKDIGSGQFGKVCEAQLVAQDSEEPLGVAVKTLSNQKGFLRSWEKSLRDEGLLMKDLVSPYIIQLMGLCLLAGERVALVMELAKGGRLDTYLLQHRNISLDEILLFDEQVAHGMAYLESQRIVHGDLAARNILLVVCTDVSTRCQYQVAKISDFGLSRSLGSSKGSQVTLAQGRVPGKIYPPEFFTTMTFDSLTDVWSFGLLMWETVSRGQQPYKGYTLDEYKQSVCCGDYPQCPPNCPDNVYQLMKKCWDDKSTRCTFRSLEKELSEIRALRETSPKSTVRNKLMSDDDDDESRRYRTTVPKSHAKPVSNLYQSCNKSPK